MSARELSATARRVIAAALLAVGAAGAAAWTPVEEAARNLAQGRCEAGVDAANRGLKEGDATAYFLVGFMLVKGLCVAAAPELAPPYLEAATKAGLSEAAELLVLMHGMGIGVPQSYAQAGRWATARLDIAAARDPGAAAGRAKGSTLDVGDAERLGVLATVQSALQDELAYPKEGARLHAREIDFLVRLQLDDQGVRYGLFRPNAAPGTNRSGSAILRASGLPHQEETVRAIDAIVTKLPPYPRPAQPFVVEFALRFNVR